jgi:threonine dehydratase
VPVGAPARWPATSSRRPPDWPVGCGVRAPPWPPGARVAIEVSGIAADSLGTRRIGTIAYDVATPACAACKSPTTLSSPPADCCGTIIGSPSSMAPRPPSRGYNSDAYRPAAGECILILLCGASADPTDLVRHHVMGTSSTLRDHAIPTTPDCVETARSVAFDAATRHPLSGIGI